MFRLARLKLTAWYLLIIMLISALFSLVIYEGVTLVLERRFKAIELRLRAEDIEPPLLRPGRPPRPFFEEDLAAAKNRVLIMLLYANGAIFILSGAAGYFLAGKTLKPIEETLEEQKRFIADASHELRTPLTALKTSIEVALRNKKTSLKEAKKILESNLDDVNNLQTLTDNLLVLAQYRKNNHNLAFEPVEVKELIKEAVEKMHPLAKEKSIDIEIKAKNHIVEAVRKSFTEMLVIFLDNAVKYTPKSGKVAISIGATNKQLLIKIEDTGIGIDKKDIPHIFDRFYRVDKSRSKIDVAGFGLGLSLAKRIIDMHKGSVDVSSVLNKGTTFTIKLPLKHS